MIKARHQRWADKIFNLYITRLLKKHFASIKLFNFPNLNPDLPTLLIPNHNTWWDGFFIYFLNKKVCKQRMYIMMLNEQLQKYSFFSRVGAYGISPDNPKGVLRSLQYSIEILQTDSQPRNLVCIFPDGDLQPWNSSELNFKSGVEWIVKHISKPLNLLPLAMRCEFIEEQLPELFFLAEENYIIDNKSFKGMQWLEKTCQNQMLNIEKLIREKSKCDILLSGKKSVSEKFDTIRGK